MNDQIQPEPIAEASEALLAPFLHVGRLVPGEQQLETIPPEMRVSEALKIMDRFHYSQLPVVAGDTVLGVFSYRSFSTKATTRQKGTKVPLGKLPVEDFLEEFEYLHSKEDWSRALRYLNRDDAFFVGHREGVEGIVTTMDVLNYFREIADPFIMIAEIELVLRRIIQTCVGEAALPAAIERSLHTVYPDHEVPQSLNEMTFNDFVQIIANGDNWAYFEPMFGSPSATRKRTWEKLEQIGRLRNTVFHFRRWLEPWELEALIDHREWLQRRARAFEGRLRESRRTARQKRTRAKASPRKTTRTAFLEACDPAAKEFFAWMLDEAKSKNLTINWGAKGFSVRKRAPHGMATLAYGFPPARFELYLKQFALDETREMEWRSALLEIAELQEGGRWTLRGEVNAATTEALREVFSFVLDKVKAWDR